MTNLLSRDLWGETGRASIQTVELEFIATFDPPVPTIDVEDGEPGMSSQDCRVVTVPIFGEEVSEATVLFSVLSSLSQLELERLVKLSLCFLDEHVVAPWLDCEASPLHNGKLWLRQHKASEAACR